MRKGFNFTFAGNIGKVQNLENIIMGFSTALNSNDKVYLNIIGSGSNLNYLKRIVKIKNITNVYFWGRRPLKEIPQWLCGSDVLIISLMNKPIFSITVPAKFQTYLASKKPILCVMEGEVANIVKRYSLGYVSLPENINNIGLAFKRFIATSQKKMEGFGNNMEMLLNKEFNRNKIIELMTKQVFNE